MAKAKIVRCKVFKQNGGDSEESVRYVPLEVFELWRHLMTEKHLFEVREDCTSLWFDIDGDPHVSYAEANYDKVVRLSVWVYSDEDGMFRKITRYFPLDRYEEIKPRFLAHYDSNLTDRRFPGRIEETHGVWLKRSDR
jgi:hypothetical protein